MKRLFRTHFLFVIFLLLFGLLLFKDPFSQRTLIPNFEPYPDALYYISSARNFAAGKGLIVMRENRILVPAIPPLYSFSLSPAYIFTTDPRAFYFINLILALSSFFIFYHILIKLIDNKLIRAFILFLYTTNYFIYWFPTLAMAENLNFLVFLLCCFLLLSKTRFINVILMAIFSMGFYEIKYASIPLTVSFLFFYLIKLLYLLYKKELKISKIVIFLTTILLTTASIFIYENFARGSNPLANIINLIIPKPTLDFSGAPLVNSSPWFSLKYMKINIWHYLNAITGGSERFLWDNTPLVHKFVGVGGLLGLLFGLVIRHFRLISSTLLATLLISILFMSTFYSIDMRYIYQVIPVLLLGFGILLSIILEKCSKRSVKFFFLFLLLCYFVITSAIRIKSQISLNLRYVETPWYYISVLKANEYFTVEKISNGKKPILISALPPYFVDFYSNGNYTLLPLSYEQEFQKNKMVVWGPNDYSDLPKLYTHYINEGYDVYVSRYGLGNEGYTNRDFQTIMAQFDSELVLKGCYEQCNIYKLSLKSSPIN